MSAREGTQVFLRVRPLNAREQGIAATARCLEVQDGAASLLYTGRDAPASASFGFDRVLGDGVGQAEAFEARPVVGRALGWSPGPVGRPGGAARCQRQFNGERSARPTAAATAAANRRHHTH